MTENAIVVAARAPVLCVGDIMLDSFVYGTVERLSPEAPVPVLRYGERVLSPGGCGNVAVNAHALGAPTIVVGAIGEDRAGGLLSERLAFHLGSENTDLIAESGRVTTTKTRFVGGGQHLLRLDEEVVTPLREPTARRVLERCEARLAAGTAVLLLSDYAKGGLPPELTRALIADARRHDVPSIVDPKGPDYEAYAGATVLTPNLKELAAVSGRPVNDDEAVVAAARDLGERLACAHVLVTRSEKGMTLVSQDARPLHVRAVAKEVHDVSGAGDTVVATLAMALAAGEDLKDAVRLANLAAGIVVGKLGTASLSHAELMEAQRLSDLSTLSRGVVPLDEAQRVIARWRQRGERIGFTNGVFDLLHPGHLSLIRECRRHCDRLVLGINSDASVRRLKGPQRPVQNEAVRSTILAALEEVELVVIFEDDTPLRLIEALRPDVLVKGADYRLDQVVGASFVQGYGGRVVLAPLREGFSTTSTIGRIHAGTGPA